MSYEKVYVLGTDEAPFIQRMIERVSKSGGGNVVLENGEHKIYKKIKVPSNVTVEGESSAQTVVRAIGNLQGALFESGTDNVKTQNVRIQRMTLVQSSDLSTANKCLYVEECENFVLSDLILKNSSYEGVIAGNFAKCGQIDRIRAINCGNGGKAYGLSTAGVNITGQWMTISNCTTTGCGQGYELGGFHQSVVNCRATSPGAGTPSMAFNIGSNVGGITGFRGYRLYSEGYASAFACANGRGRLSNLLLEDCEFHDGEVSFGGGEEENYVKQYEYSGAIPDTYGSCFRNVRIYMTNLSGCALMYNPGPAAVYAKYGREPLIMDNCELHYMGGAIRGIGLFGNISGKVLVNNCRLYNVPTAPEQGDIAVSTSGTNYSPEDISHFTFTNNHAYVGGPGSEERPLVIKKEGFVI
jgi:hypothetical protein